MAGHWEFSRRLKELLAGENQYEVAAKLGYTQSRVSQISRGEKPSRAFVERAIEVYDLPREEWLALAGYGPQQSEDDRLSQVATAAAQKALLNYQEGVRAVRFWEEAKTMLSKYGGGELDIESWPASLHSDEEIDRALDVLRLRFCPAGCS